MLHSIRCGDTERSPTSWGCDRIGSHFTRSPSCQSRQRIHRVENGRHYSYPSNIGNESRMTLTDAHTTHLHHIFYALCRERNWSLGFPTSFDFGYLDADNRTVQARIIVGDRKPTILFHPMAFNECDGHLVKGLLHHELCHHLLGSDVGHGPAFTALEEGWDDFMLFKSESVNFARTLQRRRPKYVLSCDTCGLKFERNSLPVGRMACRGCCEKFSNGKFDDNYNLHIGVVSMSES